MIKYFDITFYLIYYININKNIIIVNIYKKNNIQQSIAGNELMNRNIACRLKFKNRF